jgi:carbonic anhydrase
MHIYASETLTPKQALEQLMKGNARFVKDQLEHPNRTSERREAIVANQKPFAIIVGCADSRVSPEIIFDQGVGDIFVVRVAGNVIGPLELNSIDYAALVLNSVVIVVMGHENCGAVNAVVSMQTQVIEAVAALIQPAADEAYKTAKPEDVLKKAIKLNAINMRNYLVKSDVVGRLIKEKGIEVHAAYYNLQTGAVELLD